MLARRRQVIVRADPQRDRAGGNAEGTCRCAQSAPSFLCALCSAGGGAGCGAVAGAQVGYRPGLAAAGRGAPPGLAGCAARGGCAGQLPSHHRSSSSAIRGLHCLHRALQFITENRIVAFIKGTKQMPMCGFSNTVVQVSHSHLGGRVGAGCLLEVEECARCPSSMAGQRAGLCRA